MSIDAMVEAAARLLSSELGRGVELVNPVVLESESAVVRVEVREAGTEALPSVIVKQVSNVEFDLPGHVGPPSRFLNEWATLDFLTQTGVTAAPSLVAGDVRSGLIVIEDLGVLPDLEAVLMGADAAQARRGLIEIGRLLGELHAGTLGGESQFRQAQTSLGTRSPLSDATIDQRYRLDLFLRALEMLGLHAGSAFWDEVVATEASIHDESTFRSLIHADAGPHNVLVAERKSYLVDFEFAVYRNALCDLVGARLGFPQTKVTGHIPPDVVETLESAYRTTIAAAVPAAEDQSVFKFHLSAAAGHWALNRWAYVWRTHVEPRLESGAPIQDHAATEVSDALLVLDGFVETARTAGEFLTVADAATGFSTAIRARWPNLTPSATYPALRSQ